MISSITLILVMINAQLVVKSIVILPSICTMLVLFCIFFVVGVYWCYNDTHFFGIFSLFQNNAWHAWSTSKLARSHRYCQASPRSTDWLILLIAASLTEDPTLWWSHGYCRPSLGIYSLWLAHLSHRGQCYWRSYLVVFIGRSYIFRGSY